MEMNHIIAASIILAMVTGCTSLESKKIAGEKNTPSGLTYRLPAKKFSVTASFEITGCTASGTIALLDAAVSSELTESLVGGEAYTIDYEELNTWTKITNTDFQLSEAGLLTGVNASITDQSGAVLANSVSSVASVARAVALPSIPVPLDLGYMRAQHEFSGLDIKAGKRINVTGLKNLQLEFPDIYKQLKKYEGTEVNSSEVRGLTNLMDKQADPCDKVSKALAEKKEKDSSLNSEKKIEKERAAAVEKIDKSKSEIVALGGLVDFYDKLGDQNEKDNLLKRIQIAEKSKKEGESLLEGLGPSKIDEISKALEKLKDKLTLSGSREFVPTAKSINCVDAKGLAEESCQITVKKSGLEKLFGRLVKAEDIKLPIVVFYINPIQISSGNEQLEPVKDGLGIAYRIPVPAIATVKFKNNGQDSVYNSLIERVTQVPQLGPIGSINLNNIAFDDNLIEVAFNPNTGAPSKLAFKAKSKAEAASSAAKDAASMFLQLKKDKQADTISANKVMLEQASSQLAYEKAVSDLSLSKAQSSITATKAQAELQQSLVSTQLQLLRDQQRLDAVRTGTATAAEVELEALNTQEQLLAQRLKIIKLERELAEQAAGSTAD